MDALGGRPGVYSARYAGEYCSFQDNVDKLLLEMDGKTDRRARFRTVIAWVSSNEIQLFSGEVRGTISKEIRGKEGFGYDPVFIPEREERSFAEMSPEEKNAISHRRRAVDAFSAQFLKTQ